MSEAARPGWRGVVEAWQQNPEWRKLFLARATSLFGSWFNSLALVQLTVGNESEGVSTQGALALAIVFILKQVPITILGPLAGVVADRFDRRKICIACEAIAACVVCGFLLLRPGENPGTVWTLTILQVATMAFFLPAYQALLPNTVKERHLTAANVASSASWSIMFALGMALGGIVMTEFGWRTAIVVDAISYLVAALFVTRIRVAGKARASESPQDSDTSVPDEPKSGVHRSKRQKLHDLLGVEAFRRGLSYAFGDRTVRRLVLVKFSWGVLGSVTLILALLGRSVYQIEGSEGGGVAYLWFCRAVGTLFGPLLAYRFAGDDPRLQIRAIQFSFWASPLFYLAFALQSHFYLGGALIMLAHLGGSTLWVTSTVLLQKTVPDEFRGRTFAADFGLVMLSSSGTLLMVGLLLEYAILSIPAALLVCCTLCLTAAACWSRGLKGIADDLHHRLA